MYLRRLEIAGFKSFGDRVKLDLESGVSAIVGPNGSGKSNIAEAIRWVLGERAGRTLRTAKTEELIFSGTEKGKAKASVAEVSITLTGLADGSELPGEELKITRKLYRSGESEYRINGRRVLVREVAKLLARAGFGVSSYTVIGQGMVERMIIASPAERKLLFEEASGIRAFEIERTETTARLRQARDQAYILAEEAVALVPERDNIARQVDRLGQRREVAARLKACQKAYYAQELERISDERRRLENQVQAVDKTIVVLQTRETALKKETDAITETAQAATRQHAAVLKSMADLDSRRKAASEALTRGEVELEIMRESLSTKAQIDTEAKSLAQAQKRLTLLNTQLAQQSAKADELSEGITVFNDKIRGFTKQLTQLRQALRSNQRAGYIGQALGLAQLLARQLADNDKISRQQFRIMLHKLIRMVKLAHESDLADAPEKIAKLQQQVSREMTKREEVIEKQTAVIIRVRSLELDIHSQEREIATLSKPSQSSDLNELKHQIKNREQELAKLRRSRDELDTEQDKLRHQLGALSNQDTTDKQVGLARELEENRQQIMTHQSTRKQLVAESSQMTDEHTQVLKQARSWGIVEKTKPTNVSVEAIDRDEITRLEAELTLMGEIDETLVETHRELAERVDYLESQAHDMQRAVADLETILTELERRIKTTFQENFAKINTAFGKHFAQLFGGGTAALTLTPLEDGSYGIEISVRPPAKRLTALSALSGGEKALSAIALLAAILDINPSPFVVLDEVDAALDDHNAQLFQKTLARLAKRSQILVITHNHETMVNADRLYGVTASPRTASTVLTVDLTMVEAGV